MKYFEQKRPHCLIKANAKQSALLLYAKEVMYGTVKKPLVFELSEVCENDAYSTFKESLNFEDDLVSKDEIDSDFYSEHEMILVISRELLSEEAKKALTKSQ